MCAGALLKRGVKISAINPCKAFINIKIFEALQYLTLHDLIYSEAFIVTTV